MERSLRSLILLVVVPVAGGACLIGLAVGAWSLTGGRGTVDLLLVGALALGAVLLVACLPALWLGRLVGRPLAAVERAVAALGAGQRPEGFSGRAPAELGAALDGLVELGGDLEQARRRAEQEQTLRARELRSEALRRFAEGIAREVQKPLSGVIGFSEMALRQEGVGGQLKNYLTLIDQEARSGRGALERVLRYGRDEDFATEPLDVNQLLVETSQGLTAPAERERIRLQLNLAEDLPAVLGDRGQLMEVVNTLLANAREALLPAGGTIELSTNSDETGQVVVMVRDSGRGIPAELQEQVFTPFFTSKGNRKGAGLSLAIAASIVRRHGGTIDFFSTPGQGSVFFVHLPPSGD